jgi:hypothetical protein
MQQRRKQKIKELICLVVVFSIVSNLATAPMVFNHFQTISENWKIAWFGVGATFLFMVVGKVIKIVMAE